MSITTTFVVTRNNWSLVGWNIDRSVYFWSFVRGIRIDNVMKVATLIVVKMGGSRRIG